MATEGMAEYICECKVKGIGKKLSQDIVERFGRKTFDVILNQHWRLTEVNGIGLKKIANIHRAFKEKFGAEIEDEKRRENELERERSIFYNKLGLSGWLRRAIEDKYGEHHAVGVIKRNPYQLAEDIDGVGFKRADEVAEKLGYGMLQRNLLYTAVTRAKDVCLIVGQKNAIYKCIAEWRMTPRITRLKERL